MSAPLVSIVIPCYNQGRFIRRTLVSVLQNKYRPIEILVVDDGSTDDSAAVVQAMQLKFPEIKLHAKENGGVSSARNYGIRQAQSEYIAFLDADDLYYPDSLAKRMQVFIEEDEPDLAGVYCPIAVVDDKGHPLMESPLFKPKLPNDRLYYTIKPHCPFIPSGAIVKKSKMLEQGLFDETICPAEDFDLWQKMLRQGGYFRLVRDCLVGWVQHAHSASHSQILRHYRQNKRVVDRVFKPHAETPIEQYREGYGQALYHSTVSETASYAALLAVISGEMEAACEIARDVSYFFIQKVEGQYFDTNIRICASRVVCRPESVWLTEIWPKIKGRVCEYFEFLERFHGARLPVLKSALELLEKEPNLEARTK